MNLAHDIAYFFAGAFLANAVPHYISGVLGRPFQSPFAKPPGQGLSSSSVNVIWGFFCFLVGFLLVRQVGLFDWRVMDQISAVALGAFLTSLLHARHFGRFHGGRLMGSRLHGGDANAETRAPP